MARLISGRKTCFKVVFRDIERRQSISFTTAKNIVENLKKSWLINVDEDLNCIVLGDRFVCLITAFHNLEESQRGAFSKHLLDGDYESLSAFGYNETLEKAEVLTNLSGSLPHYDEVLTYLSTDEHFKQLDKEGVLIVLSTSYESNSLGGYEVLNYLNSLSQF